jgi:kumamolisin
MKKILTVITTLLMVFLTIIQPVLADTPQSQSYIPLTASNVIPLLRDSEVIKAGDVEPDKQLSITIALKLRNKDILKKKIGLAHSKRTFGRVVSDQDLKNSYLPDINSHNKIIDFLKSNGLQTTKTYSSHMAIQVQGSAQSIEKAFNVKLSYYTYNGEEFFANSMEPQLPADIAGLIESIDGLNSLQLKPSLANSFAKTSAFTPQQIQKAYNFTSAYANNLNGQGINLAIATNYSFKQSDINYFLTNFGITGTKPIKVIPIDGTPQYDKDGSLESTMDIETALSSAPGAQLLVYDGANSNSTTQTDLFTHIVDDEQANIVSYSWGLNENMYSPSQLNAMDSLFLEGTAKGMTFVIASGDNGSKSICYPATDPYITAVGGTTLSISSSTGQISSESAWSPSGDSGSSGGGVSSVFTKPSWQQGITTLNSSYRMIPDVALNANPNTGYMIYFNGGWNQVGGTSAAAPEWAAVLALVDQSRLNNGLGLIGLANPDLYSLANGSVFHDITSGSNGAYSCLPGYDMVTGLGSVDVGELVNALSSPPVGTPSGLTATPVNATQINITWNAVSGATSYKIYRSAAAAGTFLAVGTITSASYNDQNLSANTTYYYKVSAVNAYGEGAQSNVATGTTTPPVLTTFSVSGLTMEQVAAKAIVGATMTFTGVSGVETVPDPVTTGANGSWSQSGFLTGGTYRVTPSMTNYTFAPAYLDFSSATPTLNFTGLNSAPTAGFDVWPLRTTTDTKKIWTIKFSAPVNWNSMTSSCIYVADDSNQPVSTTLTPTSDVASVQVSPVNVYTIGKKYWLFITNRVAANSGNGSQNLSSPVAMPFMINTNGNSN